MSSLVVDTNMSALQALNDLNATDSNMSTAINRLSSGLQIQNAATGPAQYVISQALESQANGYNTAIANAQNGVSLIQTASGALSQISSILQTMNQLALTSANGATATTTSLAANTAEFTDLKNSINEIAKTTTFGTTNLLIGKVTTANPTGTVTSPYTGSLQVGAFNNTNQQITLSITAVTAKALGFTGTPTAAAVTGSGVTKTFTALTSGTKLTLLVDGSTTATSVTIGGSTSLTAVAKKINTTATAKALVKATVATTSTGNKQHLVITTIKTGTSANVKVTTAVSGIGLTTTTQHTGTAGTAVSLSTSSDARSAVTAIQTAIKKVDSAASTVGATQNELQAIVSNLTVGQQNLTAANSQLVNVNMAQEMTAFSTDQILMQSGVAMLAQAQQAPSLVLKLI